MGKTHPTPVLSTPQSWQVPQRVEPVWNFWIAYRLAS